MFMIAYTNVAPLRFAQIRILVICPSCWNSSSKINFWLPLKGSTTFSRIKYISNYIVRLARLAPWACEDEDISSNIYGL